MCIFLYVHSNTLQCCLTTVYLRVSQSTSVSKPSVNIQHKTTQYAELCIVSVIHSYINLGSNN